MDHKRLTESELRELAEVVAVAGPNLGSRWRHKATGGCYIVISIQPALLESTLTPVVLYERYNPPSPIIWCRPAAEFLDGRYEPQE